MGGLHHLQLAPRDPRPSDFAHADTDTYIHTHNHLKNEFRVQEKKTMWSAEYMQKVPKYYMCVTR